MSAVSKARVAVVGATGYAGAELVRLLTRHPGVTITVVTSERDSGRPIGEVHPNLASTRLDLVAVADAELAARADLVFTALPHGTSAALVRSLLESGLRVVDLGADFRFRDRALYEKWYGPHEAPDVMREAVYGLTEYCRDRLPEARLVANPGCYPTGALLALLPLAEHIRGHVIVDAKSGTSGAGRAADARQLYAEVADNVRPYKIAAHRHQPEIACQLESAGTGRVPVLFSPHLVPMGRGLLTVCYVDLGGLPANEVGAILHRSYRDEEFVRVLDAGYLPEPRNVRGTNRVEIGWLTDPESGLTVVVSAIDNLGKGAAGQAVQNMNAMLGAAETTALEHVAALP